MALHILKKNKIGLLSIFLIFLISTPLFAGGGTSNEISWHFLIIGLFGGLAFFLYGMELMSEGLKQSAGEKMRSILATLTKNRIRGLFVGTFITMIIQSSSATTVMLVSFVESRLMQFPQTMGVILGAGLGTTITAQLIAFKLTDYALLMLAIGFFMKTFSKDINFKNIGNIFLGFGILFYGMKLMSDAMSPLRTYDEIINIMKTLENPFLGLLAGTVFTALIQSSSAFLGIMIILGQQGLITLEASVPMVFGANIGTCISAAFASINASREAKRVAVAHALVKMLGVLLFIFWIPAYSKFIIKIGESLDSDIGRQIANAHTFFNISIGILFLPFTTALANFITNIVPSKEKIEDVEVFKTNLDETKITTPSIAIDLARMEIFRMARTLERMIRASAVPFATKEPKRDKIYPKRLSLIEGIDMREEKIDFLEEKISNYLIQVVRSGATKEQTSTIYSMMSIIKDMESIGDIIHRNILKLIPKKHALENDFSDEGKEELTIYHEKVCNQIRLLKEAFFERDYDKAKKIMKQERKFLDLESQYRIQHLDRVMHNKMESLDTHEVHTELMNFMTQIIVYTSNIAKTMLAERQS